MSKAEQAQFVRPHERSSRAATSSAYNIASTTANLAAFQTHGVLLSNMASVFTICGTDINVRGALS